MLRQNISRCAFVSASVSIPAFPCLSYLRDLSSTTIQTIIKATSLELRCYDSNSVRTSRLLSLQFAQAVITGLATLKSTKKRKEVRKEEERKCEEEKGNRKRGSEPSLFTRVCRTNSYRSQFHVITHLIYFLSHMKCRTFIEVKSSYRRIKDKKFAIDRRRYHVPNCPLMGKNAPWFYFYV